MITRSPISPAIIFIYIRLISILDPARLLERGNVLCFLLFFRISDWIEQTLKKERKCGI